MVRGTRRKIPTEKITKKNSLSVCFTKRRDGLYSKASQICLLSGAQIAVLATPLSSQSNISFFSFGHSSVDAVVSAFLTGHRPVPVPEENKQRREDIGVCLARKDLGLGFWWNDEKLNRSENPEEVKDAIESMSILLSELRSMKNQAFDNDVKKKKKEDVVLLHQGTTQALNQTLNLESTSAICCNPNDTEITREQDQIQKVSDNICVTDNGSPNGNLDEWDNNEVMDIDELIDLLSADGTFKSTQSNFKTPDDCLKTDTETIVLDGDLAANLNWFVNNNNTQEEQDQIMPVSENSNNDLPARSLDDQEIDFDQFKDFEVSFDGLLPDSEGFTFQELEEFSKDPNLFSDEFEAFEDRGLDEDELCLSDVFNGFN